MGERPFFLTENEKERAKRKRVCGQGIQQLQLLSQGSFPGFSKKEAAPPRGDGWNCSLHTQCVACIAYILVPSIMVHCEQTPAQENGREQGFILSHSKSGVHHGGERVTVRMALSRGSRRMRLVFSYLSGLVLVTGQACR